MPARLEKTKTPGVFKRGSRYVVIYRDLDGRQRQESGRTYDQARRLRCSRVSDVDTGGYRPPSRVTLAEYARGWVERHQGSSRGSARPRATTTAATSKATSSRFSATSA